MPCYEPRDRGNAEYEQTLRDRSEEFRGQASRFHKQVVGATMMLCSACRALVRLGYDMDENPALSAWWEDHKKADAANAAAKAEQDKLAGALE